MNAQTIVTPSGERLVVLPEAEFDALVAAAEDASDAAAVETFRRKLAAGDEELVPVEVVDRTLAGESRVRVWREHRRLSAAALAEQAGIEPDRLSEIEAGTRAATLDELRRLASPLGLKPDDLADRLGARVRQFVIDTGEGEAVQRELIERGPVPTTVLDGWDVERIEDGMVYVALYTNHTRDDGETVRVIEHRLVTRPEVWEATLRSIEQARRRWHIGER